MAAGIVHVPCEFCGGRIACPVTEVTKDASGVVARVDATALDAHYRKNHYDQAIRAQRELRNQEHAEPTGSLLGVSWT